MSDYEFIIQAEHVTKRKWVAKIIQAPPVPWNSTELTLALWPERYGKTAEEALTKLRAWCDEYVTPPPTDSWVRTVYRP